MSKKDEIKIRFKERIDSGKSILYKSLKNEDASLLYAIERHFGSISKLCEDMGITQQEMIEKYGFSRNINKRTLTEDEIKERLLHLKSIGKLTTNAMRNEFDDLRLEISIKKLYGSVDKGLAHFGLKRDTKRVTKNDVLEKIKECQDNGIDLCYSSMLKYDSTLVHNAQNKFKIGWNQLLNELSVEFNPKRIPYDRDSIKDRLDKIYDEYGEVNHAIIRECDGSILFYAGSNYNKLEDFYIDMGYDPAECMDYDTQKSKGRRFELVFKEILEALNIEFKHNKHYNKKLRPDFQLDNGVWIDCKLSSWTSTVKETVRKYDCHCEKIIIVYLRGNKRKLYEYNEYNVEFRKVDFYYPMLEKIGRNDLILKCQEILNPINY